MSLTIQLSELEGNRLYLDDYKDIDIILIIDIPSVLFVEIYSTEKKTLTINIEQPVNIYLHELYNPVNIHLKAEGCSFIFKSCRKIELEGSVSTVRSIKSNYSFNCNLPETTIKELIVCDHLYFLVCSQIDTFLCLHTITLPPSYPNIFIKRTNSILIEAEEYGINLDLYILFPSSTSKHILYKLSKDNINYPHFIAIQLFNPEKMCNTIINKLIDVVSNEI